MDILKTIQNHNIIESLTLILKKVHHKTQQLVCHQTSQGARPGHLINTFYTFITFTLVSQFDIT